MYGKEMSCRVQIEITKNKYTKYPLVESASIGSEEIFEDEQSYKVLAILVALDSFGKSNKNSSIGAISGWLEDFALQKRNFRSHYERGHNIRIAYLAHVVHQGLQEPHCTFSTIINHHLLFSSHSAP